MKTVEEILEDWNARWNSLIEKIKGYKIIEPETVTIEYEFSIKKEEADDEQAR